MKELPLKIQEELLKYFEENKVSEEEQKRMLETIKTAYQHYRYDPEEAVGVVCAQSLSEPATQMSISPNEKIILKKDGITAVVSIGEFVDRIVDETGYHKDGWDVCDLSSHEVHVPSITKKEKIEWKRVLECSRHRVPEHLIRISTLSGRKIIATDSHSFVVRRDNQIVPVAGTDLTPGERLPVVRHLRDNCTQCLELKTLVDTQGIKKKMPEVLRLDGALGWFMGAYLAEGNSTKYFVSLSNTNPEFLAQIRKFAEKYGFTYNEYDNTRGFAPSHDIRINSTLLSRLLTKACNTGSKNKKIPHFAYGAAEQFVSSLLRGYFDGDGNVSVGRMMIRASSNSEDLINGILLLLSRFGIFATKQKRKQFSLIIPHRHAKTFKEKIGFSVPEKQGRLEKLCSLDLEPSQDFIDMVGGFGNLFLDIAKKISYPTRYVNNFTKRGKIGRGALSKYIEIFARQAEKKGMDIEKELSILRVMASSDVVWDEIVEIEKIKPTSEFVYDLTVEGTETFTTFEGIITHNTMRTYHFAGTAGIQVTLGLPRMLEIFDARKEPRTPTMTVHIKPEDQSIEKVKEIAENIKEVKAKELIASTILDLTDMQVVCKLSISKIKELGIDLAKLPKIMKIRNADVKIERDTLIVAPKKKDMSAIHKLKHTVLDTHVKGIKGISQVVVIREGDEWVINTLGSNLKKVFDIDGVDPTRTTSNDIMEIQSVLGIEAARNAIVEQAVYTMEEQGLNVDVRYIMLLADLMTFSGEIRAIGRYGISGQKASVLVRASFEETKKHLVAASIRGERDIMAGTIENIMVNQVAPIGTGAFGLVGSIPRAAPKPAKKPKKKPAKKPAKKKPAKKKAKKGKK